MEGNSASNLKIVYLVARFHPYKGGAEENCFQLAKRTAEAGHEVTVITTSASPDGARLKSHEIYQGINIVRVKRWNRQLNLGFYPGLLPKLIGIDADIIHVENGPGFIWHDFCIFTKRIISRGKTKFVTTPHGPFLATNNSGSSLAGKIKGLIKLILSPYFKLIWRLQWDMVIQVNPNQTKWMQSEYGIDPKKIQLIPNGISQDYIEPAIIEKPKDSLHITYIGRISWYKGVQNILYALDKLKDEDLQIKATIMGKTFHTQIPELAKELNLENVTFLENPDDITRDRILSQESHVHILPSQWEATGIVLLEAMAKQNAIITTTGNEAAEMLITNGENGYIYEFEDVDRLSSIIKELASSPELVAKMIQHNRSRINRYTWETITPKYLKVITDLCSQK